jgi:hypothetical protein
VPPVRQLLLYWNGDALPVQYIHLVVSCSKRSMPSPLPPTSSLCTISSVGCMGEVGVWRGVCDNGGGGG